ncbi:iron-containing alcohol dehydrogenase [Pseudomonas sp. N040]|uniref:iron-containing alcohol dehydrogenase n=1 Tax=Pseudomonas sp. N040 TaxID=2785325 RepID=UPI0018A3009E|nr:iron-containing alcohol dehydrogenase [Pseudomonas sp. N040]MBF7729197.1 iron-containing alcohol dehydrogenase [Pseudomonas sp. N040]MBW7012837.1 iron-containing alcohol dehydrogenase [Pseudomonas sp. N040]
MSSSGAAIYWQRSLIHSGHGSILRLPSLFNHLGAKRVFLISDAGLKAAGVVDKVLQVFAEDARGGDSILAGVFCETAPDTEMGSVNAALAAARAVSADAILALGGGSVMDCAKAVKYALHKGASDVRVLLKSPMCVLTWPQQGHMGIFHISVPTTAGTGSEVSNGAVVYNPDSATKHLLIGPFLESDIAVLDAGLTLGLPPMLTAATGLDALTHAMEVLALPNVNDFSLAQVLYAAQSVVANLPKAVANGRDIDARQALLNASAMACSGLANNLGAAPVHNISHAVGALFHIHHGEANAVLLPICIEQLPEFYAPTAARLAEAVGVDGQGAAGDVLARVVERLRRLLRDCNHPLDYARHQLDPNRCEELVAAVLHDPLAALYPLPAERVVAIARAACAWN